MAFVNWQWITVRKWEPANRNADAGMTAIKSVDAGTILGPGFARVNVPFNGTDTDAEVTLGQASDVDTFLVAAGIDEYTAAGPLHMAGGGSTTYSAIGMWLFTAADTIDVNYTADTTPNGTQGDFDFWWMIAKVDPH